MENKKVVIGSDHAGFSLKEIIKTHLAENGYAIIDMGTNSNKSVDYPDYSAKVARESIVLNVPGIVICGTGIGASISANKIKGIRAALCHNTYTAIYARRHNDANILAIGARAIGVGVAFQIIDLFLKTEFEGGRHKIRVEKISKLEEEK